MSTQVGRIAFREEGTNWNAYYATMDTMEGAIFLGSIPMRFVMAPSRKERFMELMQDGVADIIEEQTGHRPTFPKDQRRKAPEHERSRNA